MLVVGENSVRAVTALMSLHVLDQPHLVLPPMPVGSGALLQLSSGGGWKLQAMLEESWSPIQP